MGGKVDGITIIIPYLTVFFFVFFETVFILVFVF